MEAKSQTAPDPAWQTSWLIVFMGWWRAQGADEQRRQFRNKQPQTVPRQAQSPGGFPEIWARGTTVRRAQKCWSMKNSDQQQRPFLHDFHSEGYRSGGVALLKHASLENRRYYSNTAMWGFFFFLLKLFGKVHDEHANLNVPWQRKATAHSCGGEVSGN